MTGHPTFLLAFGEVQQQLGKTPAATRMWLSRHGLRAERRVAVGERATRALYDGEAVARHADKSEAACAACSSVAPVTLIDSGTSMSAQSRPHES